MRTVIDRDELLEILRLLAYYTAPYKCSSPTYELIKGQNKMALLILARVESAEYWEVDDLPEGKKGVPVLTAGPEDEEDG